MAPRVTHSFLLSHHYACVILSVFVFMLCPAGGIVPSYASRLPQHWRRSKQSLDVTPPAPVVWIKTVESPFIFHTMLLWWSSMYSSYTVSFGVLTSVKKVHEQRLRLNDRNHIPIYVLSVQPAKLHGSTKFTSSCIAKTQHILMFVNEIITLLRTVLLRRSPLQFTTSVSPPFDGDRVFSKPKRYYFLRYYILKIS